MAQLRHRARFFADVDAPRAMAARRIDELDRDEAVELRIARAHDDAHAAAPDHLVDHVAAKLGSPAADLPRGRSRSSAGRAPRAPASIPAISVVNECGDAATVESCARQCTQRVDVMIDPANLVEAQGAVDVRGDGGVGQALDHAPEPNRSATIRKPDLRGV